MKQKIKTYSKFGILAFGIALFLTNCEKEAIPELQQSNENINAIEKTTNEEGNLIYAAKAWFEQNKKSNNFTILEYSKPLDWNSAFVTYNNDTYSIEVPLELKDHISISLNKNKNVLTFNRLLFLPSNSNDRPFKSYIANFHDSNNNVKKFNSHSTNINYFNVHPSFNGKITLLDSKNRTVQSKKVPFSNQNSLNLFGKIDMKAGCLYLGWWYEDGTFEALFEMSCPDTSVGSTGGGSGGGSPNDPDYGGGGGTGNDDTPTVDNEITVKIVDSLTGKTKCVYVKMVDGNNNINWILENFNDGDKPSQFNLIFQMSTTMGDETNASTATPVQSGIQDTFVISINQNRAENINTSLTIARTILHEGIHARLWEFYYRNGPGVSNIDFPGIYDFMRTYDKNWDHEQMAAHYRETIATGLKQFDNGQHSDSYYNALAWEGLAQYKDANGNHELIYSEAWDKLSTTEQQEILNIISNEKQNGSKDCN